MTSEPAIELPLVSSGDVNADLTLIDDDMQVRRTILPGGIRVVTQPMPGHRSASIAVWCPVGSRDEDGIAAGSSHFLEHLLFKGTSSRSALEIAESFDRVGGDSNAGTTREYTYYWARLLGEDLPMAVDVIFDMITSSTLMPEEFERERGVILEELAMGNDDPMDVVHEGFTRAVFGDHPLGQPVGGTPESVRAANRDDVHAFYRRLYTPDALVVTAAGAVNHVQLCELVMAALARADWELPTDAAARRGGRGLARLAPATPVPHVGEVTRSVEQSHVVVGGRCLPAGDERQTSLSVLLALLGGSMSSRLFQQIRERRGLAYSTYAFSSGYTDAGYFGMYAGCAPAHADEVERLMVAELDAIAAGEVSVDEVERVKSQLRGRTALELEECSSRMHRLGRSEVTTGRFVPIDLALARLAAVEVEDVVSMAGFLAEQPRCRFRVCPQ